MEKGARVLWAFIGIFVMGVVSGSLLGLRLGRNLDPRRPATSAPAPKSPAPANTPPQQLGAMLMRRIVDQLDLSSDQKKQLKPIEMRTGEDLRRLRRDTQHSTELVIDRMHDEIAAILTSDQRAKFDDLILRRRERIKKFFQDQELRNHAGATPASRRGDGADGGDDPPK